jgi:hypothetical protein
MNDREFKKHLHAMARGEELAETEGPGSLGKRRAPGEEPTSAKKACL